jgi:hypothetical protein
LSGWAVRVLALASSLISSAERLRDISAPDRSSCAIGAAMVVVMVDVSFFIVSQP